MKIRILKMILLYCNAKKVLQELLIPVRVLGPFADADLLKFYFTRILNIWVFPSICDQFGKISIEYAQSSLHHHQKKQMIRFHLRPSPIT